MKLPKALRRASRKTLRNVRGFLEGEAESGPSGYEDQAKESPVFTALALLVERELKRRGD